MLELARLYRDRGITIIKGEAQYVWDSEGRRYLDAHTGHGVAFLGHRHPRVVEALRRQLDEIMAVSGSFGNPARDEMLRELSAITPGHWKVFMQSSGAEAVELALKLALKATGRRRIVAFTRGFHGRTLGALSVTWNPRYRSLVAGYGYDAVFAPYNKAEEVEKHVDENTAAVIVELVQGEGGVVPADPEFAKSLEEAVERSGALLIVDDVQAGFGRTGTVWSWQRYGLEPHIFTAGKSVGGGFPVSLVFARPDVVALKPGEHGTTFGGNPMAAAAVAAAARVLREEGVPERAGLLGSSILSKLSSALEGLRLVREARGVGLMVGVELRVRPSGVIRCMQCSGVLALSAGSTVVRLLPPYLISNEDVERLVGVVERCVSEEHRFRGPGEAA